MVCSLIWNFGLIMVLLTVVVATLMSLVLSDVDFTIVEDGQSGIVRYKDVTVKCCKATQIAKDKDWKRHMEVVATKVRGKMKRNISKSKQLREQQTAKASGKNMWEQKQIMSVRGPSCSDMYRLLLYVA